MRLRHPTGFYIGFQNHPRPDIPALVDAGHPLECCAQKSTTLTEYPLKTTVATPKASSGPSENGTGKRSHFQQPIRISISYTTSTVRTSSPIARSRFPKAD